MSTLLNHLRWCLLFIMIRTDQHLTIRFKRKITCQNQHSKYYYTDARVRIIMTWTPPSQAAFNVPNW